MKYLPIIAFLFLVIPFQSVTAQYQITIDAQVFDKTTRQPLQFVNIKFLSKEIKTITNTNGKFQLSYDEATIKTTDSILFSAAGYRTQKTSAAQLYRLLKNSQNIYLVSKTAIFKTLQGNIYGRVFSNKNPLQGATVRVKNSFSEVLTDSVGNYSINANKGAILLVNSLGMKPKEIRIEDNLNINVLLEADGSFLNEVVVKGKKKKKRLIDLGLGGKKNYDAIGYSVNLVTAKDIKPTYTNLMDVLGGKFAGIKWSMWRVGHNGGFHLRSSNSINNEILALYDLDGQIIDPNNGQELIIDVQNIETIAVLKSLASTNKYGSMGRGGVIVIRTKSYGPGKVIPKPKSALIKGNDYLEDLNVFKNTENIPSHVQLLQNTQSFEAAKKVFEKLQEQKVNHNIPFFLDAADYFLKWDATFALKILTKTTVLASENAKALRTIAFKYEALEKLEEARKIYQRIAVLRPKESQSYRDLALIYAATGYYKEALQLYKQMLNKDSIKGVDFSGLEQPIANELMHLLAFHKNKLDVEDIPEKYLKAGFKQDLRIVFEWNDPYAEFELQSVNPEKKFYSWSHTLLNNRNRMADGIKKGYSTETYLIDDAQSGKWIINIEAFNEKVSTNPNFLKYTVYKNYGLVNETKTVNVIQLQHIKQKVTLDIFNY